MEPRRCQHLSVAMVGILLASGLVSPLVSAQDGGLSCEDFASTSAAQITLDQDPSDPFGLDADENGIACDELPATSGDERNSNIEDDLPPLSARLGSTVEDWEAKFGAPIEREGPHADLFTEYDITGYSTVFANEYLGRIERITLFAPRPEGEEWSNDETHDMDWTVPKAHELARRFLPRDAHCGEPDADRVGGIMTECFSDALFAEIPAEIYDYVDNTPVYGGFSYWIDQNLDDESRAANIFIELEIEEPLV